MKHSDEQARTIAETIAEQLGGAGAFFMIGASKQFRGEDSEGRIYVQFSMMRNASRANWCRITYEDAYDTYVMEFRHVPRQLSWKTMSQLTWDEIKKREEPKTMKVIENVYCDTMRSTFESETGLTLTPPRIIGINA